MTLLRVLLFIAAAFVILGIIRYVVLWYRHHKTVPSARSDTHDSEQHNPEQ